MTIYFGENIKKLRKEKELTQETLAEFLGVSFQAVSKWERGETYPDIAILPAIASFFNVSIDDLFGYDKMKMEEEINKYLEFYNSMYLKDTPLTFEKFQQAVKIFPGDFRILVRYMELLMAEKTTKDLPKYEKVSKELMSIYENIQNHCTDDSIRMWAKRLICQHLHTKSYYTNDESYQKQAEEILAEMPDMVNTREYLSTMLIADKQKHYEACSHAIETHLRLLENAMDHYCFYDDNFSVEYKIEAMNKMNAIQDIFFTDKNYGKLWMHRIYNYGHLGHLYFASGDIEKSLMYLKISAEHAKEYDELPKISERSAQFFEGRTYEKTPRGKTMCERMKILMTERYPLTDEFKSTSEFQQIISMFD